MKEDIAFLIMNTTLGDCRGPVWRYGDRCDERSDKRGDKLAAFTADSAAGLHTNTPVTRDTAVQGCGVKVITFL